MGQASHYAKWVNFCGNVIQINDNGLKGKQMFSPITGKNFSYLYLFCAVNVYL